MKILFIGTVKFSYKALEKLISLNSNVVGVITKEKSNFNSDFVDLTPLCIKNNIAIKYVDDINLQENIHWIKRLNPDIVFCFGWSSLLKHEMLNVAPMGVIGYHPANLPKNRGRHPLIWALVLGLKKSASTFFFMSEGADDGDIISQVKFDILYEDDANSLYEKVTNIALKQIEIFVDELLNNKYQRIRQDSSKANLWRKRSKNDGVIDFRMSSYAIYNLVRALTKPYVGATLYYKNEEVILWKVEEVECELDNIEYGKVLDVQNNTILVKCYDKAIRILEHTFVELPRIGEYL